MLSKLQKKEADEKYLKNQKDKGNKVLKYSGLSEKKVYEILGNRNYFVAPKRFASANSFIYRTRQNKDIFVLLDEDKKALIIPSGFQADYKEIVGQLEEIVGEK